MPGEEDGEAGRILLGAETRALLQADAPCSSIGAFPLKGRSAPVEVYLVKAT